jgi:predicted RNA-binding protein YlxR (DUF448 family)
MSAKSGLIRLVWKADRLVLDETGRIQGRGMYVCPRKACLDAFLQNRRFRRRYHSIMESGALDGMRGKIRPLEEG